MGGGGGGRGDANGPTHMLTHIPLKDLNIGLHAHVFSLKCIFYSWMQCIHGQFVKSTLRMHPCTLI